MKARLGPDDLVIDSGMMQVAGFSERVAAASAAGFTAISMWGRDRSEAHREGLSDEDIRRILDDYGVAVADLSALTTWLPGTETVGGGPFGDGHPFFGWSERDFLETGEAFQARSLSLTDIAGLRVGVDEAAEAFAGVCDRAAEHGLLVQIEFMSMSSLPTIGDAWAVVQAAGRPNGGIVLDTWHFFRTGTLEDLDADSRRPGLRPSGQRRPAQAASGSGPGHRHPAHAGRGGAPASRPSRRLAHRWV